jgi:K+-transporting ATPase ATPase C chain
MLDLIRPAITVLGLFTLLLGVVVPVLFTGFAQAVFPTRAGGSLIVQDGRVIGSALVGQHFTGEGFFHPRPSATSEPYDAAASSGSNLAPTSASLLEAVKQRVGGARNVPADAVTSSGSGLDPHISPENAARQVARVAAARGLAEARVAALVAANTEPREFGFLGEKRVNVLRLNLALHALR